MELDEFTAMVNRYLLPQFPITLVEPSDTFKPTILEATQPTGAGPHILAVKPRPNSSFRMILKRAQWFDKAERDFIRFFIQEAEQLSAKELRYEKYLSYIQNSAVSKVLSEENQGAIQSVISFFDSLKDRTYEGKNVAFSILIDLEIGDTSAEFPISSFIEQDFFIVLTNGVSTCIDVDKSANVIGYREVPQAERGLDDLLTPAVFTDFCSLTSESKIGAILTVNGDILLFKNKELVFARRRGSWKMFSHEKIVKQLAASSGFWSPELRKAIYLTALDISFMHTGGLIYASKKDNNPKITSMTFPNDVFSSSAHSLSRKAKLLKRLVGSSKFQEVNRLLRKEICSIDGAVLLHHDGTFGSIGAIVTQTQQTIEGSRSAAAIGLSIDGFSIKISTDGAIKGYFEASSDDEYKPRFVVG